MEIEEERFPTNSLVVYERSETGNGVVAQRNDLIRNPTYFFAEQKMGHICFYPNILPHMPLVFATSTFDEQVQRLLFKTKYNSQPTTRFYFQSFYCFYFIFEKTL